MKKTLAILISAILVVAAVCAFALTSGAAAATTVSVSVDGGTAIELNATTTTATHAGTGSFAFDAATGTLTLNNFKGNASFSNPNGVLTVKIVGENVLNNGAGRGFSTDGDGSEFVFTADTKTNTSLTINGGAYALQCGNGGKLTFKNNAVVVINASADPIHFGAKSLGMSVEGNAEVTASLTEAKWRCVGMNGDNADTILTLKDNAKFTVNGWPAGNWQPVLNVTGLDMLGGTLTVNNNKTDYQVVVGLKVGYDSSSASTSEKAIGNFSGGTINVNLKTTYQNANNGTGVAGHRAYGIFFNNVMAMNFTGTNVNINADLDSYEGVTNYTGTGMSTGSGGMIGAQNGASRPSKTVISGGTFNLNGANADTAFCIEGTQDFTISGGTFKGSAISLFKHGNFKVDFDKADFTGFTCSGPFIASGMANVVPLTGNYNYIPLASSVAVTATDGTVYTLNKENPTLSSAQATAIGVAADAFKYTEPKLDSNGKVSLPVLEMKNVAKDKVAKVHFTGTGSAIVKVSGVNYISGTANVNTNLFNVGGVELLGQTADAALNVSAPTNGTGNYVFCFRRALTIDSVKVNVYAENGDAVHGARTDYFPNNAGPTDVVLKGTAELNVEAYANGLNIAGGSKTFLMQDNAKVTIKPVAKRNGADNTRLGNGFVIKADKEDGTGTMTLDFAMKDNASLKVEGKGVECNRIGAERVNANEPNTATYVQAGTKVITTFTLEDNAKFDVEGNGQGLYIYTSGKAEATFVMKDNASFKAIANDRPTDHKEYNTGKYQSGLQINGSSIDVDLLGGTFHVEGERNTWNYGALALNSAKTDLLIQDTKFTVKSTNNTVDKYMDGNTEKPIDFNYINNAIIIPSGASVITIAGKSVVDVSATNDTAQSNRAHALFLQGTQKLIVKDEAVATFTAGGTATANTGAAIHSKGCEIIVQDKATLNASATGTASAAITLEGAAKLTVEGEAKVNVDGGSVAGIRNYNASASGSVVVKSGTVIATGKSAISSVGKAVTVNAKTIEAGASASAAKEVDKLEYNEGYVKLSAVTVNQGGQGGSTTNPGTSDVNVALFAVVALATVAVAAAVVLRKKSI